MTLQVPLNVGRPYKTSPVLFCLTQSNKQFGTGHLKVALPTTFLIEQLEMLLTQLLKIAIHF